MTTRKQLESAIVRLSIELDGAKVWAAHQDKMADKHWMAWRESCREVESLLRENSTLRATIEQDEAVIHAMTDERAMWHETRRSASRTYRSTLELEKGPLLARVAELCSDLSACQELNRRLMTDAVAYRRDIRGLESQLARLQPKPAKGKKARRK
jgi:outer membrane protein TolC